MVLSVFVLMLLVAVSFFQCLHGLFSALIMLVLTVLCSTMALTHYEWLHQSVLASLIPEYGQAVALMGLFLIPLGLLRLAIDKVISGNMVLPHLVDRIGALIFGVVTGFLVAGMTAIGFQLLPFDARLLGFQRVFPVDASGDPLADNLRPADYPSNVRFERKNLWLNPDGVTVQLAASLAEGVFSVGEAGSDGRPSMRSFKAVHPDFLNELHWWRDGVQRESRHWVAPDALTVEGATVIRPTERWIRKPGPRPESPPVWEAAPNPPPDTRLVAVKVRLVDAREVAEKDGTHRFRAGQVRLTCYNPGDLQKITRVPLSAICYKPGAFGDEGKYVLLNQAQPVIVRADGEPLGLAFEVPPRFDPWFVQYKSSARAEIYKIVLPGAMPQAPPSGATSMAPPSRAAPTTSPPRAVANQPPAPAQTRDRISSRYIRAAQTRFSDKLPVPLSRETLAGQGAELDGSRLQEGHVVVELKEAEEEDLVTAFEVPDGLRLFQLGVEKEEARSIFGRAIQFTRRTLEQYTVIDQQGNEYHRIGEIRLAAVDGREVLEMQYHPQTEMPERAIEPFRRVQEQHLSGDFTLVYLYLLPEGRRPVQFSVGGKKVRDTPDVPEE